MKSLGKLLILFCFSFAPSYGEDIGPINVKKDHKIKRLEVNGGVYRINNLPDNIGIKS